MTTHEQVLGHSLDEHVAKITNELAEYGIRRNELSELDHLCFRVETPERYKEMQDILASIAVLQGETKVQGRPISVFQLHDFIDSNGWIIPYIELPAPKEGSPYPEGLEHAEFVVRGNLKDFVYRHPEVPFDTKAAARPINPEYGLKNTRAAMKFHQLSIGAVVNIEQAVDPIAAGHVTV